MSIWYRLQVNQNQNGLYHIHLGQDNTAYSSSIILEDLLLNEFHDLKQNSYSFNATADFKERFVVHYSQQKKQVQDFLKPKIKAFDNNDGIVVQFDNMNTSTAHILITNLTGQVLFEENAISTHQDFEYKMSFGQPSIYLVRVITSELTESIKLFR